LVSDLGKFDPEEFETSETAFVNLLSQTHGTQGESLEYVARDAVVPAVFADDAKRRMYQLPLTGGAFKEDNKQTFRLLKSYLINTPGWTWIESFNATENGCGAFLAWATHYNGQGELSKCMAMAKAKIKNLLYKNEQSLTFKRYWRFCRSHSLFWTRIQMKDSLNVRKLRNCFHASRLRIWKWWHRSRLSPLSI
jgi:hypothetical protein